LLRAALTTLVLALPSLACAQTALPKAEPAPALAPLPRQPAIVTAFKMDAPQAPPPQTAIITDVRRRPDGGGAPREFMPDRRFTVSEEGVRFTGSGLAFLRRF
jgi:hypothetical protein